MTTSDLAGPRKSIFPKLLLPGTRYWRGAGSGWATVVRKQRVGQVFKVTAKADSGEPVTSYFYLEDEVWVS